MPVRRILSSLVLKSVEPTVREWVDAVRRDTDQLRTEVRRDSGDGLTARLTTLEEENVQLKKKLSMAMGAIQAASAQIVQLRQEAEQAQNLAHQAMQRATSAQATAEAATEGVTQLETPSAARAAGMCKVDGCSSKARTRGYCTKHYKQLTNGTLGAT